MPAKLDEAIEKLERVQKHQADVGHCHTCYAWTTFALGLLRELQGGVCLSKEDAETLKAVVKTYENVVQAPYINIVGLMRIFYKVDQYKVHVICEKLAKALSATAKESEAKDGKDTGD